MAGVLLVGIACGHASNAEQANSSEPVLPNGNSVPVDIVSIVDGDSVKVRGPDGDMTIRLLGMNSPEADECLGDAATRELSALLSEGEVLMFPWPAERDEFGRRLGFLVTDDGFVNLGMVESGYAVARAQSDHDHAAAFELAEKRAIEATAGIWARDACGPAAAAVEILEVLADAPGDDRKNPNGEWVLMRNAGKEPLDLLGWSLRDESTRHRYDFPSIRVDEGAAFRVRTGCGVDDVDSDPIELYWCDPEPPVWNNSGDTAFLLDPNGSTADHFRTS